MITNVTKDSMTVSWKEPADDGKSTILGYFVERKTTKEINWTKLNRKPITERTLEVTGLTEGVEYEFRVIAINAAGLGKPSEPSASCAAQNPISEFKNFLNRKPFFLHSQTLDFLCCFNCATVFFQLLLGQC